MLGTTKSATSATVTNRFFRYLRSAGGSSGSAPSFRPTTRGALAPPSPASPWQVPQCSSYNFCPSVTCAWNDVAGAAVAAAPVVAAGAPSLLVAHPPASSPRPPHRNRLTHLRLSNRSIVTCLLWRSFPAHGERRTPEVTDNQRERCGSRRARTAATTRSHRRASNA